MSFSRQVCPTGEEYCHNGTFQNSRVACSGSLLFGDCDSPYVGPPFQAELPIKGAQILLWGAQSLLTGPWMWPPVFLASPLDGASPAVRLLQHSGPNVIQLADKSEKGKKETTMKMSSLMGLIVGYSTVGGASTTVVVNTFTKGKQNV